MSLQVRIGKIKSVFFSRPKNTSRIQLLNLTLKLAKNINSFEKNFHIGQKTRSFK
jgi:hypothetical protein